VRKNCAEMKAEDLAVLSGALKRRRIDAEKGIPHSIVLTINKGSREGDAGASSGNLFAFIHSLALFGGAK